MPKMTHHVPMNLCFDCLKAVQNVPQPSPAAARNLLRRRPMQHGAFSRHNPDRLPLSQVGGPSPKPGLRVDGYHFPANGTYSVGTCDGCGGTQDLLRSTVVRYTRKVTRKEARTSEQNREGGFNKPSKGTPQIGPQTRYS